MIGCRGARARSNPSARAGAGAAAVVSAGRVGGALRPPCALPAPAGSPGARPRRSHVGGAVVGP